MTLLSVHHPATPSTVDSPAMYLQSDDRHILLVNDLRARSYRLWA